MYEKCNNEKTVPLFDEKALKYDEWYRTPAGRFADRVEKEAVLALLEPHPGMSVLDVGCGTGNYSLELAGRGLVVTGLDASPEMIKAARAKAEERGLDVEFVLGDALQLPFGDGSFDAVICVCALEFLPDPKAALLEAYRVLKPGGRLVAGVIGRDSSWGRFYREKAGRDPGSVFGKARFFTLEELRQIMPGKNLKTRAVLFVPPDFDWRQEGLAGEIEEEARRAGREDGGFICAVSEKVI